MTQEQKTTPQNFRFPFPNQNEHRKENHSRKLNILLSIFIWFQQALSLFPINPNHPWNKPRSRKNKTDKQSDASSGGASSGAESRAAEAQEKRRKLGAWATVAWKKRKKRSCCDNEKGFCIFVKSMKSIRAVEFLIDLISEYQIDYIENRFKIHILDRLKIQLILYAFQYLQICHRIFFRPIFT